MVPVLTSERLSAGELDWTFDVPGDSPFFQGHFPGHPILPGVVALAWMQAAADRLCGAAAGDGTLLNVKFQTVITPGARLHLSLTPKSAGMMLGVVRSEGGVHASALIPVPKE